MSCHTLVSVCIPSYNNEDFIGLTLESVLQQTYRHLEIIIADDHSTDRTVPLIQQYADPRIRLVRNETNLGMGDNWNKVLALATGKYVKLMCGDDLVYPDCLARQVAALESPAGAPAVLAVCNRDVINARGEKVLRRRPRFPTGAANGWRLIRECVRRGTNVVGEPVVGLFRREVLAHSVRFDPTNPYMIDLLFWAAVLKHGEAYVDSDSLAAFRISASSVSAQTGFRQAAQFRRFVRQIHADPFYRTKRFDVARGCLLSVPLCLLRNLLIRFRAGSISPNN